MKLLVTGGAGYVGSKLTAALLEQGHEVTVLEKFLFGSQPLLHLASCRSLTVVEGDVRELGAAFLAPFDGVFHLAGLSGFPACQANPFAAQTINADASRTLGTALSREQFLVYASTTSVYGQAGGVSTEDTPVTPVSAYGVTKLAGERYVLEHPRAVSLRFATIFGVSPRMRTDLLVNDFAYRGVSDRCIVVYDGGSRRTFMHIDDAIDSYLFCLENLERMTGRVYNVGSATLNLSKAEIADAVRRETSCAVINEGLPDPDRRDFEVSFDRIAALGYRVRRGLDEGVREMVRLFRFYRPHSNFPPV